MRRRRRSQSLQRRHFPAGRCVDRQYARALRLAVDEHGAGTALAQPAAEARPRELEIVTEHVKQRRTGIDRDGARRAVHLEDESLRHGSLPLASYGRPARNIARAGRGRLYGSGSSRRPSPSSTQHVTFSEDATNEAWQLRHSTVSPRETNSSGVSCRRCLHWGHQISWEIIVLGGRLGWARRSLLAGGIT